MNLNSAEGKAKSLKQVKTSLRWYDFVLNLSVQFLGGKLVRGFGYHHKSHRNTVSTYETFKRMNFYLWATICLHGKSLAISLQ